MQVLGLIQVVGAWDSKSCKLTVRGNWVSSSRESGASAMAA